MASKRPSFQAEAPVSKDVETGFGWRRRGLWNAGGLAEQDCEGGGGVASAWAMKSLESLDWPQPGRGTDMKL